MFRLCKDGRIFESLEGLVDFWRQSLGAEGRKVRAYRGHADEDWRLVPRLFRGQRRSARLANQDFTYKRMTSWQFMADLLEARVLPETLDLTYKQLLAVAQHYPEYPGACGTELLDFSRSLGVAASFAFHATSQRKVGAIYFLYSSELEDPLLRIVEEIELPDFFVRPTRQKAVFMRQFSTWVDEPSLMEKHYFVQSEEWPASLGSEYSPGYLLKCPDDPVLRFAQQWTPHISLLTSELGLRWLLELEHCFLGIGTKPKRQAWPWLDAIQESLFDLFRNRPDEARSVLSSVETEAIQDSLSDRQLVQDVQLIIELIRCRCMELQGEAATAEEHMHQLLSSSDCDETRRTLLNHLGNLYLERGDCVKALRAYKDAASLRPSDLVTAFNVAATLKQMGQYEEALQELNRIVFHIDGDDALTWSERANTLNNLEQFRLAIDSAERALELDPLLAFAWGHQGISWSALGEHERGAQCFRRMLSLRPDDAWALYNLTVALHFMGAQSEAVETFRRLRLVDANYPRLRPLGHLVGAVDDGT